VVAACACFQPVDEREGDAGLDGGVDAGIDAGRDAGFDAGSRDAGRDAGFDAGFDAGTDAGLDAGVDAGRDAGLDAGTDAGWYGQLGSPCISDADCATPGGMFCLSAFRGGMPSGFPGGMCTASCEGGASCPAGTCGALLIQNATTRLCVLPCPPPSFSCRMSYLCGFAIDGSRACAPRCNNPGATCPPGTTCRASDGFCV
jgi:hypothetical protein